MEARDAAASDEDNLELVGDSPLQSFELMLELSTDDLSSVSDIHTTGLSRERGLDSLEAAVPENNLLAALRSWVTDSFDTGVRGYERFGTMIGIET